MTLVLRSPQWNALVPSDSAGVPTKIATSPCGFSKDASDMCHSLFDWLSANLLLPLMWGPDSGRIATVEIRRRQFLQTAPNGERPGEPEKKPDRVRAAGGRSLATALMLDSTEPLPADLPSHVHPARRG